MSKYARKTPEQIRENLFKEISPGCRELLQKCNNKFKNSNPKKPYQVHRLHDPRPKVTEETEKISQYIGEMSRGCSGHISSYAIKQDAYMHDRMIKQIIEWHRKGIEALKQDRLDVYERYKHLNIQDLPPMQRQQKIQSMVDDFQAQTNREEFQKRISRAHALGQDMSRRLSQHELTQMQIRNVQRMNEALLRDKTLSPAEEAAAFKEIRRLYDEL